jgi:uncharacterized protein (TIGR02118 family)
MLAFYQIMVLKKGVISNRRPCISRRSSVYFFTFFPLANRHYHRAQEMTKLIALYRTPPDKAEFDRHYEDVHTPLVRRYPGLRRLEITRTTGAPIGEAKFYLMAEMYFDSQDAMNAALASKEGKAIARDLMGFAAEVVTVFFGETKE